MDPKGMRKARSVLRPKMQSTQLAVSPEAKAGPSPIRLRQGLAATQLLPIAALHTNNSESSYNPSPSPTRNPHVHTTATEKYYLQIISTMKKEMTSLLQIIKAKDKEIEQLREARVGLKASNNQLRAMLTEKATDGRRPLHHLSTSFDVLPDRRKRRNEVG